MTRPITWALVADHRRIGALLAAAIAGDRASYAELRGALLRHIGIEEKIVLPALRAAGCDPPMASQLKLDHSALATMLVPTPTPELLDRIAALLALHDPLEEGDAGLYLLADAHLASADDVLERIARAPVPKMAANFDDPRVHVAIDALLARAAQGRARR